MPKTKIVCTIGPASNSPETIQALIEQGMTVARLNFSHGSHAEHRQMMERIRTVAAQLGRTVAILQDLSGPKIRIGTVADPGLDLKPGDSLILTVAESPSDTSHIQVNYNRLADEVEIGDRLLLADGLIQVVVVQTTAMDIHCEVINGGLLTSNKGLNLPTRTVTMAALTEKDKADLAFGLEQNVDFVALSFVRSADDIRQVKGLIDAAGKSTPVIAKIEKHEAIEQIDDILSVADGIMVARGDLGVEIPLEDVPRVQKQVIRKANGQGKPVIIATQMLRSMVESPRPTRAEAADVANGVLDGADAIMLSEETASGRYPVEAVTYMARIAEAAERDFCYGVAETAELEAGVGISVSYAAGVVAARVGAAAIIATTRSGATARHIARFRPCTEIIALSPDPDTVRRLCLCWGCTPRFLSIADDTDEMIEAAAKAALTLGPVRTGDRVVITAGRPVWHEGTTNMLWVKELT